MSHESPRHDGGLASGWAAADHSVPRGTDTTKDLLDAVATVVGHIPGSEVISSDSMGVYAVELAMSGWEVFPLRGKVPAIPGGRGFLDATTDLDTVVAWWSGRYAGANIGARVPEDHVVLDVDPRHDGDKTLADLEARHRPLPETMTVFSGREDGGKHLYFEAPRGELTEANLGPGLDLKRRGGYLVMPPSRHPDTGRPYRWADPLHEVARMPVWLALLVTVQPVAKRSFWDTFKAPRRGPKGLVDFVARQGEGEKNRNKALFWALNRAADNFTGDELDQLVEDLVAAAMTTGLSEREARLVVRSVRKRRGLSW